MTTYFISRHSGAINWTKQQGIEIDKQLAHLDTSQLQNGHIVIGTLPINSITEVCEKGGRCLNLSLDIPAEARGKELTPENMITYNARLEEYTAEQIGKFL